MPDQNSIVDYSKPHPFEVDSRMPTHICKCGAIRGTEIHAVSIDYSKPHAFDMEVGRITRVCKCGQPQGVAIHAEIAIKEQEHLASYFENLPKPKPVILIPYTKHTNTCLQKAEDDMPLFILKPTDPSAIGMIEAWYIRNMGLASNDKLDDALNVRNAFQRWQEAHPDRIKNPD